MVKVEGDVLHSLPQVKPYHKPAAPVPVPLTDMVFSWIPFFELSRRGGFVRSWAERRAESGSMAILA
jgi:hypothetical protein